MTPSKKSKAKQIEQKDGALETQSVPTSSKRERRGGDICAIFVHAGAGYHSLQNEEVHLGACSE